jgi:hypothetical protein
MALLFITIIFALNQKCPAKIGRVKIYIQLSNYFDFKTNMLLERPSKQELKCQHPRHSGILQTQQSLLF